MDRQHHRVPHRPMMRSRLFLFTLAGVAGAAGVAHADVAVQFDVSSLLNSRSVTTLTGGSLVTFNKGVDGTSYSGLATVAAAARMGSAGKPALPDDGIFPANQRHPEVRLHFSNADGNGSQVRFAGGADSFAFSVPAARYTKVQLFCISANGDSKLSVGLVYADGGQTSDAIDLPDWYPTGSIADAHQFYLAANLPKWNMGNGEQEGANHNLYGMDLSVDATRTLVKVAVTKSSGGTLTFWGATGVTDSVPGGGGGGGGGQAGAAGAAAGGGGGNGGGGGGRAGNGGGSGSVALGDAGASGRSGAAGQDGLAGGGQAGAAGAAGGGGAGNGGGAGPANGGGAGVANAGGAGGANSGVGGDAANGCGCVTGGGVPAAIGPALVLVLLVLARRARPRLG